MSLAYKNGYILNKYYDIKVDIPWPIV